MRKQKFKKAASLALSILLSVCMVFTFTEDVSARVTETTLLWVPELSSSMISDKYELITWRLSVNGGTLTEDILIPEGVTLYIVLDGHLLNMNGHHFVNYGTLKIMQGDSDNTLHRVYKKKDGTLTLERTIRDTICYNFRTGTIFGGKAENGALVENYGSVEFGIITVALCEASGNGGVIYNAPGSEAILSGGRYFANVAHGDGGCIYNLGELTLTERDTFEEKGSDGPIVVLENNEAWDGYGGGVYSNYADDLEFISTKFVCNKAKCGGGLYVANGAIDLINVKFNSNEVKEDGAGLYIAEGASVEFTDEATVEGSTQSEFNENKADKNGGAVYNCGELETFCVDMKDNTAGENGGAVYNNDSAVWTLSDGGIFTAVQPCTITGNSAGAEGGAVYNAGLLDCEDDSPNTISSNHAGTKGGAIASYGETILGGDPLTMTENTADENAGAVYYAGGTLTLYDEIINISGNKVGEAENNLCVASEALIICDGFEGNIGVNFENPKNNLAFADEYDPDDGVFTSDDAEAKIVEKKDKAVLITASGIGSAISGGNIILIAAAVAAIVVVMVVVAKKKKKADN